MTMKKLSKQEIARVEALVTELCATPEVLDKTLAEEFGEKGGEIRADLERGVDKFYQLYNGKLDQGTLRNKLTENMKDMSQTQRYTYLLNLTLALTQVCGNIVEGPEWNEALEAHQAILDAVRAGTLDEQNAVVSASLDEMLNMIVEQSDAFAVLFLGDLPYEELLEACVDGDPAEIQALAANTRGVAVSMSAALYILHQKNQLPSLEGAEISPEDMGVMSASLLEIDAAHKCGSWERAKDIIQRAARAAVTLLVASPSLLGTTVSVVVLLSLLTSFSTIWMLIGGAVLFINARMRLHQVKEHIEPICNAGGELLDTALDKAKDLCASFKDWVSDTILPRVIPVWHRFRDFAVNKVILPAAAFLLQAVPTVKDTVKGWINKLREKAESFRETVEDYAAQADQEETQEPGGILLLNEDEYTDEEETVPPEDHQEGPVVI